VSPIRSLWFALCVLGAGTLLLATSCNPSGDGPDPSDPARHFEGASVHLSVPANPGGGYDRYARLLAPYLAEELGAARVVIENAPEAGGLVALNELLRDGSQGHRLVLMNGVGAAGSSIASAEGADFSLDEFSYVGRVVAEENVWVASRTSDVSSLDEALAKDRFRFGATGPGASAFVYPVLLSEALGLPEIDIVTGFDTAAEAAVAATRGDIDGLVGGLRSRLPAITDGDHVAILSLSEEPLPELPDIPAVGQLPLSDHQAQIVDGLLSLIAMGRPVVAAPETPDEHLDFLRRAFDRAIRDPDLLDEAAAAERPLEPLTGEEMQDVAATLVDAPSAFRDALVAAY